jgi:hypothetical protein
MNTDEYEWVLGRDGSPSYVQPRSRRDACGTGFIPPTSCRLSVSQVIASAMNTFRLLRTFAWLLYMVCIAAADTHFVDINSTNSAAPYTSWETATTDIQVAVDAADNGDTVLIADGTYNIRTQINVHKGLTIRSVNGRDSTIIDANGYCRVLSLKLNKEPIALDGFTITDGHIDSGWMDGKGGGVLTRGKGHIEISNCIVENCKAKRSSGGGISILDEGNSIFAKIKNCFVRHNEALHGGGIATAIWDNSTGSVTIENCAVYGNHAAGQGGGIINMHLQADKSQAAYAINCTIVENQAEVDCGGAKNIHLSNSILYRNTNGDINDREGLYQVVNSCAGNAPAGNRNINSNPKFVNAREGDYRLQPNSPCVDAGFNVQTNSLVDLDGNPRIVDGDRNGKAVVDMGAYEFQVILVEIDIKPGIKSNFINLKTRGLLPVAILTTDTFDASTANPVSVRFAEVKPVRRMFRDVDTDGDADLLLYFQRRSLKLDENSTRAILTGETKNQLPFIGIDTITVLSFN